MKLEESTLAFQNSAIFFGMCFLRPHPMLSIPLSLKKRKDFQLEEVPLELK